MNEFEEACQTLRTLCKKQHTCSNCAYKDMCDKVFGSRSHSEKWPFEFPDFEKGEQTSE